MLADECASKPFRLLHITPDDKFVPLQCDLFERAFPGQNEFRVVVPVGEEAQFAVPISSLRSVDERYFTEAQWVSDVEQCDCIVYHSLNRQFVEMIAALDPGKVVVWSAWGFEYYRLLGDKDEYSYLDKTAQLVKKMQLQRKISGLRTPSGWASIVAAITRRLLPQPSRDFFGLQDIAARLDLVSVNRTDLKRLRSIMPSLQAQHCNVPYYTTEDTLSKGPEIMQGPDLLIGNSATPTNNHLEVFDALDRVDITGRRLIVPLSYGDMDYADYICRVGEKRFGDQFLPLRGFMPIEEFSKTINSCGLVVMNHIRQQAYGTISQALFKGSRVFLREENPLYGEMIERGAVLRTVSDLPEQLMCEPDPAELANNTRVLGAQWAREAAVSHLWHMRDLAVSLDRFNPQAAA